MGKTINMASKPIAPMFSALLGRRPMAPGELQAKVRKLMTTPARQFQVYLFLSL